MLLEEQSRLLCLPCAPGSTVYMWQNDTSACHTCGDFLDAAYLMGPTCNRRGLDPVMRCCPDTSDVPVCEKQKMVVVPVVATLSFIISHLSQFGQTVFLTEAEALRLGCSKNEAL